MTENELLDAAFRKLKEANDLGQQIKDEWFDTNQLNPGNINAYLSHLQEMVFLLHDAVRALGALLQVYQDERSELRQTEPRS
jgi:hypothetical protein